jgi:DNA-binding LacI/PurR family transcriptional regulator
VDRSAGWRRRHAGAAGRPNSPSSAGSRPSNSPDWSAESGYRAGIEIAADRSITAVLAINDAMAIGLMKALDDRGLSVPGDVSIVGFDDRDESPFFQPTLTTVRLDFTEVGRRAVESVLRTLRGEAPETIPLIEPELKVRDSTGPPR